VARRRGDGIARQSDSTLGLEVDVRRAGRRWYPLGIMEPRRSVIAPSLERWVRDAPDDERRTAIVRIDYSSDPAWAAARLAEEGVTVQSAGPGSIIGVVTPAMIRRVASEPWVLAVEEPKRLFPRRR
jgi:hypothetical protein